MGLFSKRKNQEEFLEMLQEREEASASAKEHLQPNYVLTTQEILSGFGAEAANPKPENDGSALAQLRERMLQRVESAKASDEVAPEKPAATAQPQQQVPPAAVDLKKPKAAAAAEETPIQKTPISESLLRRCRAYIVDEAGRDTSVQTEPLYRLDSVEEILQGKTDRSAAPADLPKPARQAVHLREKETPVQPPVQIDSLPKKVQPETVSRAVLSDIDAPPAPQPEVSAETGTIRFTPVKDIFSHTGQVRVSTATGNIALTGELNAAAAVEPKHQSEEILEKTEFEEFCPQTEYVDEKTAKQLLRQFAVKKRRGFLQGLAGLLTTVGLAVFLLPGPSDKMLQNPAGMMLAAVIMLAVATAVQWDMFAAFATLFTKRARVDCGIAVGAILSLATGVCGMLQRQNVVPLLVLSGGMLCLRGWASFWAASARLGNLRQMARSKDKKAVVLLEDTAVTFAMAKDALESDALIAVARPVEQTDGFMKYTEFCAPFGGRLRTVWLCTAAVAAVLGLAVGVMRRDGTDALFAAAAVFWLGATPLSLLAENLPLYRVAKRLNRKGIGFAGAAAMERLEQANAVTLSATDLFPAGTVTLQDLKLLNNNSMDDTLLRAASLTAAVGSPLAPLFRQIIDTNKAYVLPDADTVKYEERRGISGWVEDELLFIGNRTLMEVHEIKVPEVEVDYSILRKGYFPVYIATGGKVCAMLVVRYDVDTQVAKVLRRTAGLGIELLVDNCDPNLTTEMICDYIGLFPDSVRVMSTSGGHVYKSAVQPEAHCMAPAAFCGGNLKSARLLCGANGWRKITQALRWMYYSSAALGTLFFTYLTFTGSGMPGGTAVLLYEAVLAVCGFFAAGLMRNV